MDQEKEDINEEIENIQNALEKMEETAILDPESDLINQTCAICRHPGCRQATEIYFENNKNIDSVKLWFSNKFKKNFSENSIEKHFKKHIEPFITQMTILKEKKIQELEKRIAQNGKTSNRVSLVKEMIFDMITDVYATKIREIKTKEDKVNYQRDVKMITDLAKSFREYYQMEFELLGFGKTEEEQKEIMKNYLKNMLNKAAEALSDIPEAKERLYSILGTPNSTKVSSDVYLEETEEEIDEP